MKSVTQIALLLSALAIIGPRAQAEPLRAAIFPFEFDDTSLQGTMQGARPDEQARTAHLSVQLADLLARSGKYQPIDVAPVEKAARESDFRTCDGCDVELARKLGAQVSVIGWVQKVSNLILNMNIVIRDVATGKVERAGSVDIRGNDDVSWSRGLAYLVREHVLTGAEPPR